jgi:hypothetical protein
VKNRLKLIMIKFSANLKNVGVISGFIKKTQGLFRDFVIFQNFSKLFLYRKKSWIGSVDHGIMAGSRSTHDHGAARPLRGLRGRHNI